MDAGLVIVIVLLLVGIALVVVKLLVPAFLPKPKANPGLQPQRPETCPPAMKPVSRRYDVKNGKCAACDDHNEPNCKHESLAACLQQAAPSGVLGTCESDGAGRVTKNHCQMQPDSNLAVYPKVDKGSCECVFRPEYCSMHCGETPDFGECFKNTDCQSLRCNNATRVGYKPGADRGAVHLCEPFRE